VLSRGKLMCGAWHDQLGREAWLLDLPATIQQIGFGCTPTTACAPRLCSDDPVLGGTTTLHLHHGPALGISIALFSNHTTTVHAPGSGLCSYLVDADLRSLGFERITDGSTLTCCRSRTSRRSTTSCSACRRSRCRRRDCSGRNSATR
jgi:hypothetical protein